MDGENNKMHNCTTLCYIENEDSYLMLHRVKKEKDIRQPTVNAAALRKKFFLSITLLL